MLYWLQFSKKLPECLMQAFLASYSTCKHLYKNLTQCTSDKSVFAFNWVLIQRYFLAYMGVTKYHNGQKTNHIFTMWNLQDIFTLRKYIFLCLTHSCSKYNAMTDILLKQIQLKYLSSINQNLSKHFTWCLTNPRWGCFLPFYFFILWCTVHQSKIYVQKILMLKLI